LAAGLRPHPLRSLKRSPDPLVATGPTSKGREGKKGREGEGIGRYGRKTGREKREGILRSRKGRGRRNGEGEGYSPLTLSLGSASVCVRTCEISCFYIMHYRRHGVT